MSKRRNRLALPAAALLLTLAAPADDALRGAELRAGFGVAPLATPPGGPLAGYGGVRDRRARGVLDPPEARALVFDRDGLRVALVALDLVIVRAALRDALLERVEDLEVDSIVLAATHTHAGPGGYIPGFLAERITAGRYDPEAPGRLVEAAARALTSAVEALAPARVASQHTPVELARNRRAPDGPRETLASILRVDFASGEAPALLFVYGMHPTVLSPRNRSYSADYVGPARAWLTEAGWRALFLPGPLGDQGPTSQLGPLWSGDLELEDRQAREVGEALAHAVSDAATTLAPEGQGELAALERWVDVPAVRPRRFCALWWLSPLFGGSVRGFLSTRVPVLALRVGELRLVALPAEPGSAVGDAIRTGANNGATPAVLAHANDWIGYVVTEEQYRRGGYEACLSFHGELLGPWLVREAVETLGLLGARRHE